MLQISRNLDHAIATNCLVSEHGQDNRELFEAWRSYCDQQNQPCACAKLLPNGRVVLRVVFPRKPAPSPDCLDRVEEAVTWSVDDDCRFDVCRHEVWAAKVREDKVLALIEEVTKLYEEDRRAR